MKKILLLDTSIGTSNIGDSIIMECVKEELSYILENNYTINVPTHLPCFNALAVWKNSFSVQNYANCDLKFAGGSNLLVKNLLTHYPQWNINAVNSKPLRGVVMVGVGASAGEKTNSYTVKLYNKILNQDYCHSVRDERSKIFVESLGLKAINTGCVTMWKLTPEFCKSIHTNKASRVVFTLTGRRSCDDIEPIDIEMIRILKRNYVKVYYWLQDVLDYEYFYRLGETEGVEIIPPSLDAYNKLLSEDNLDYVGTRLHGGIYAMRHKKRAIIISIDERAEEINKSNNINCIARKDIPSLLEAKIQSEFSTEVKMPLDEIKRWKAQFEIKQGVL